MKTPLLPWTTRGVKYSARDYLAAVTMDFDELQKAAPAEAPFGLSPDTDFTDAIPIMQRLRAEHAHEGPGGIEYGCFNHDGTVIAEPGLRKRRQSRNILYYVIRDLFNLRRGRNQHSAGPLLGVADPVPVSPDGQWAVLLSEACPERERVEQALAPLVEHRGGGVMVVPKLEPPQLLQEWLQPRFNDDEVPGYLVLCDTFENLPIEFQFVLNAFGVTGRLWFDDPADLESYVDKVLRLERGEMATGKGCTVASPVDDTVTFADRQNIIDPLLELPESKDLALQSLLAGDFTEQTLLERAASSRFLALYCHGLGLSRDEWDERPGLQGSFVLRFDSKEDDGLLTFDEVAAHPFVPGGIVFTPACMGGGSMSNSDYCAWIDSEGLAGYMGGRTEISAISRSMLASPQGPAAIVAHFDVSMASSAPMYNAMSQEYDLQTLLHQQFVRHLAAGWTVGRATKPFRWAAGAYYAQAIYLFGQMMGTNPYMGTSGVRKTIGGAVNSMNQYHVTATDMRNFLVLGDPAVRLVT